MKYVATSICLLLLGISDAYSQTDVITPAERDFKKSDENLNRVFKETLARLGEEKLKQDLRKAQSAWIKFRDSEAQFRAGLSSGGGSAYSTDYLGYLAELTDERTKQLRKVIKEN